MKPTLQGIIARRILVNFRADPETVQAHVPSPLRLATIDDRAVVGVCLVRLENLSIKGFPALFTLSSENMAHRVAVQYRDGSHWRNGVFIWRRDTNHTLTQALGGRIFPGVQHGATFRVSESENGISLRVETRHGLADVSLRASIASQWPGSSIFGNLSEASRFFREGDCGYSCALDGRRLEGMRLHVPRWEMSPLAVELIDAAFFGSTGMLADGSVEFDSAFVMRRLPHEWHPIESISTELPRWKEVSR